MNQRSSPHHVSRRWAGFALLVAFAVYAAPLFSCALPTVGEPCGNNGRIGTNGHCMECSVGVPSTSCGAGCSAATSGVCCCNGGGGGGGGGCTAGVCCHGLYECNGRCYNSCTPGTNPCCSSTHCTCYTPCC